MFRVRVLIGVTELPSRREAGSLARLETIVTAKLHFRNRATPGTFSQESHSGSQRCQPSSDVATQGDDYPSRKAHQVMEGDIQTPLGCA